MEGFDGDNKIKNLTFKLYMRFNRKMTHHKNNLLRYNTRDSCKDLHILVIKCKSELLANQGSGDKREFILC